MIIIKPIAGYEKELEQLNQLKDLLLDRDKYEELGIKTPRGVLLFGNPGVGKTMMAKSIVTEGINLVELRAADTTDENANDLIVEKFMRAKENIPSILLIDEIDKIAGTSDRFFMEDNDNASKILLEEFDSVKPNSGVLIVATCNNLQSLHPALRRSGRFDREIEIKNPTFKERVLISELYLNQVKLDKSIDANYVAKTTPNFTGAEIETLINEASIQAYSNKTILDKNSLTKALNRMRFKNVEGSDLSVKEAYKVAIHEAGHALITYLTAKESLGTVSIIPQGKSKGHISLVEDDMDGVFLGDVPYNYAIRKRISKKTKCPNVNIAFGGRAAEKVIFNNVDAGSRSDLENAYYQIFDSIALEGLYGVKYFSPNPGAIPKEIRKKISKQMTLYEKDTIKLIKRHKKILEKIADALVDRKTLAQEEVFEICEASGLH